MKKRFKNKLSTLLPGTAVFFFILICITPLFWISVKSISDFCSLFSRLDDLKDSYTIATPEIRMPHLTPWASIGGCGAGGSGSNANDGIKWIGNHVGGGLINVETMLKLNGGENFINFSTPVTLSGKPLPNITASITVPLINYKNYEVQYQTNQEPVNIQTGGFGDLYFDVSKAFGAVGQFSLALSLSIPTGQYDIMRGADDAKNLVPVSSQPGSGLYTAGLKFSGNRDFEDGILLVDFSFNYPFNISITGENRFLDEYFQAYKSRKSNKRFYYHYKLYGETDLGGFTPSSLSLATYYGYKGKSGLMHSWGTVFFVPLGVAWIPSHKPGIYDPRPDPDHKTWSAAIVYGIESTSFRYPVFLAVSKLLQDKTGQNILDPYDPSPMRKWDGPDWRDFLHQWTIAAGIKVSLF